ncbi:MAG: alpha amylase C-terminal domain-containing protein [Candidatus Melainabacteria bacterium]|nr:alpha amylase C-terminal domain-containing protein [Candidatus Melainabacteria bacterium]
MEQRISTAFSRIKEKLAPALETSFETRIRQKKELIDLSKNLRKLSPEEAHSRLKKLDGGISYQIYQLVRFVKGGLSTLDETREEIRKDFSILLEKFPPILGTREGTLLEQIAADLMLDQNPIDLKILLFTSHFEDIRFSRKKLKFLFNLMPEGVRAKLPQPPYFGHGFDPKLYKTLGAHYDKANGLTTFRVYAPHAKSIHVNLTAFGLVEHSLALVKEGDGIWTVVTPHAKLGRSYYFLVVGPNGGAPIKKVDPFALGNHIHSSEPGKEDHESIVRGGGEDFPWTDAKWMRNRIAVDPAHQPMTIYEVHAPSWMKKEGGKTLNWRELAGELAIYCIEMRYSHVEVMGAFEHPQPISMGYQITNYFVINSRLGTLEDFQFFVDFLHVNNIGVFIDWAPAHFAVDRFGLEEFDGTPLLEDDDPKFANHPQWGTKQFDFKKQFTSNFLLSNADFLLKRMHIDGLRVDAVQSMLYLNYGYPAGTRYNAKGGEINNYAKAFLRNLNAYVHQKYPGVLTMAEEASAFKNLIVPINQKGSNGKRGFGFDLVWHMGFTNDILEYMKKTSHERKNDYRSLVKSVRRVDGDSDTRPRGKVVLPLSHDETANGKKTIQKKMPGTDSERFANGRLLLAFQLLRGGGPILEFMGNEILQSEEWHGRVIHETTKPSVQWEELDPQINPVNFRYHRGARECRKQLNQFYFNRPALWDQTSEGLEWILAKDQNKRVIAFRRKGSEEQLACVFNFSRKELIDFCLPLRPSVKKIEEVFNTDLAAFGGMGRTNSELTDFKFHLAPFTAIVFKEHL